MPKFPQLCFDANPLLMKLWKGGSKVQSGRTITQPVMYQYTKGGSYSPYDTHDVSAEDQITAAEWYWKYYEWPITVSRDEILKNDGPDGVKSLLDAKVKLARMAATDKLATDLLAITSCGNDTSEGLNSLENMISDGTYPTDVATNFGSISKDSYSWWRGKVYSPGGATYGPVYANLNKAWFTVADGNVLPDFMVGHNNSVNSFMNSQQAYQRYIKVDTLASGFLAVEFNGVPFFADLHVSDAGTTTEASNRIYFINSEFTDLVSHAKENMRFKPFATPVDQNVDVGHIYWAGELISSDPSRSLTFYNFDSLLATTA